MAAVPALHLANVARLVLLAEVEVSLCYELDCLAYHVVERHRRAPVNGGRCATVADSLVRLAKDASPKWHWVRARQRREIGNPVGGDKFVILHAPCKPL